MAVTIATVTLLLLAGCAGQAANLTGRGNRLDGFGGPDARV